MPTRYPNEGQLISIQEVTDNGMFIITTDHAGILDIVKDGVNGIVISDVNQSAEIYKELDRLSISVMLKIINNNINYYRQNFKEKVYLSKIENAFDSILG